MGSLFSASPAPAPPPEPAVIPRPTEAARPPPAKRRKQNKSSRKRAPVLPPTRAMQPVPPGSSPTSTPCLDPNPPRKRKKRKVAVFLGYIGHNYSGMQINPGVITIEQLLVTAFHRAGLVSEANSQSLTKIHWMRAARTDKGVSAAGQCVSAKLECELDNAVDPALVHAINHHLPPDVQIYGILRATGGFNARGDCHRRTYEYMFPVRLLGGCNGVEAELSEGQGDPRCAKLSSILSMYEGTHCFANFTDGLSSTDDASKRFIIRVHCSQPFLPPSSGVYYVTVYIYGQSFLLHQIRKMIGVAIFIYLGHAPRELIPVALCPHVKIPTPMAPSLGLLLDSLTFENYNSRFQQQLQCPISVEAFGDAKEVFKREQIYSKIAERERLERILEDWIGNCHHKMRYQKNEVLDLHRKFILTDVGREERRKAHVASLYPIKTTMADFIDTADEKVCRLATQMQEGFKERYNTDATFLARAPGRVILIGEHLDYNGLPVIAAATTQSTMVAGCLDNTECIEVQHLEHDAYAAGRLRSGGLRMAREDGEKGGKLDEKWLQYVSWGVKALVGSLGNGKRSVSGGGRLLVGGDLPRAGGLASSSSLVTGSVVAAARLNRRRIPRQELALVAAQGERVGAGTKGGAVDHTMSMCGVKGCALEVSFTPGIGLREIRLPEEMRMVAVGSGVTAEKGWDAFVRGQFNLRAAECRVGAALVAKRLGVYLSKSVTTPGQLWWQVKKTGKLQCKSVKELREKMKAVMEEEEEVVVEAAQEELEVSEVEFENRFLMGVKAKRLRVGKRMMHVFTETERVERFLQVVKDEDIRDGEKIELMGGILNEGQESLRNLFESSCDEIEKLTSFCRESGAKGSRMTGAGWGGFTVNIVPVGVLEEFVKKVVDRVGEDEVIEIAPASGACIYAIHNMYGARAGGRKREREQDVGGEQENDKEQKNQKDQGVDRELKNGREQVDGREQGNGKVEVT
eukprot:GFKZ01001429.1.p1 GENE.GFKZ01001429.1~~GFKZ01001429.1.p1  ORF type:complete len:971 (+),score=153.15 GFKZ01001429.1:84-2996(+)